MLRASIGVMRKAVRQSGVPKNSIGSFGITNQRETTVVWDKSTGKPYYNAIVWQDQRTAEFIEVLKGQGAEHLTLERAGLPLDPYFSASKLRWILKHVPQAARP